MAIVLDANFLVTLITQNPLRAAAYQRLQDWIEREIELHAPILAIYEVNSALTQLVGANVLPAEQLPEICQEFANLPIQYHTATVSARIVEIALSLGRRSAYDAAYLALSESLNADLWTLDTPLYRNAIAQGFTVNLLTARNEG